MKNFSSIASSEPEKLRSRNGFTVKAERVHPGKHELPDKDGYMFFYVRIFLHTKESGPDYLSLEDIEMVTYRLDSTFNERLRVSQKRDKSFEVHIWSYGFFEVDATILTTWGQQFEIRGVRLEWEVTKDEAEWNGDEVRW